MLLKCNIFNSIFLVWEINTGRCLKTIELGDTVYKVAWCPNTALSLVAVAAGQTIYLINPGFGDHLVVSKTDTVLQDAPPQSDVIGLFYYIPYIPAYKTTHED